MVKPPEKLPEHGMLFKDHLARALAMGTKTVTRRPAQGLMVGDDGKPTIRVGDLIWVRETWRISAIHGLECGLAYRAGGSPRVTVVSLEQAQSAVFRETLTWRPSLHMPRWAARSVLRVTESNVEQLEPLSDDEARAEGFVDSQAFTNAWDAIYRDSGHAIGTRPSVVVLRFKPELLA